MLEKESESMEWEVGTWGFLRDDTEEICSLSDALNSGYTGEVVKIPSDGTYKWRFVLDKISVNPNASYSKPYSISFTNDVSIYAWNYNVSTRMLRNFWVDKKNISFNSNAGVNHGDYYYCTTTQNECPPNGTVVLT